MKQFVSRHAAALWLFAAALALALPFSVEALWPLSFVGAVCLFLGVAEIEPSARLGRVFRLGACFGFFYHLFLYHWLLALHPLSAANLTGALSLFVCVLAYVGAAAIHGTLFSLCLVLWRAVSRRLPRLLAPWLFLCAFLLFDLLCSVGTLAFPWSRPSLVLAACPVLMRSAALVGPAGVEAILLAFGALVAAAVRSRRVRTALLAALLLCCNTVFGLVYGASLSGTESLRVAVVQTAYSTQEKWSGAESVFALCRRQTRAAAESGAQLVVFPETVCATNTERGDGVEDFFASLCGEYGVIIAAGQIFSENGHTYNAVCLYDELGLVSFSGKRHLVPFGEYLPWQEALSVVLPAVSNMDYYRSSYTEGESGVVGRAGELVLGGLVCFDTLFSTLALDSARQGANLLVAPTNDAWFKDTAAAHQHLLHTTWRAVECGRAVCQSANAGLSAVISPDGTRVAELSLWQEGVAVCDVSLRQSPTVYSVTGDVVTPIAVAALFIAAAVSCLLWVRDRRAAKEASDEEE